MHYFKFHIGDWSRSCGQLSLTETGIYLRLLNIYYDSEKPLPPDLPRIYRQIGAKTKAERDATSYILGRYFSEDDAGYHHIRAEIEITKYREKSDKARGSAKAKWAANAMRTHTEGNANHKPLTTNHDEEQEHGATGKSGLSTGVGVDDGF